MYVFSIFATIVNQQVVKFYNNTFYYLIYYIFQLEIKRNFSLAGSVSGQEPPPPFRPTETIVHQSPLKSSPKPPNSIHQDKPSLNEKLVSPNTQLITIWSSSVTRDVSAKRHHAFVKTRG